MPHRPTRRLICTVTVRACVAADAALRATGTRARLPRVSSEGSATEKLAVWERLPSTVARTQPAPSCRAQHHQQRRQMQHYRTAEPLAEGGQASTA